MQYPEEKALGTRLKVACARLRVRYVFEAVQNSQHVFYHKTLNGCLCTCET